MAKKLRMLWLSRNACGFYKLTSRKPETFRGRWSAPGARVEAEFCPLEFQYATNIKLKPGVGPVKVRLSMEIVEDES